MSSSSAAAPPPRWRVAYWLSAKKHAKLDFAAFADYVWQNRSIDLFPLDMDAPSLDSAGPFQMIMHKLSDLWLHSAGEESVAKLETFLLEHAEIDVLDPLASVRLLCNRDHQYSLLKHICDDGAIGMPAFCVLPAEGDADDLAAAVQRARLRFPLVCKPLLAHGSTQAHQMSLVLCESGLAAVRRPCVAQQFVAHGAILHKVFVIGDRHFTLPRPSLRDFEPAHAPTIHFHSHDISKDGCTSELAEPQPATEGPTPPPPTDEAVAAFLAAFKAKTGLALFGVDLISQVEPPHRSFVIDVNTFPGYDRVPAFFEQLADLLETRLRARDARLLPATAAAAKAAARAVAADSGLGSSESDASDCEKARWRERLRRAGEAAGPDWKRIKQFYGIPKPNVSLVVAPRPVSAALDESVLAAAAATAAAQTGADEDTPRKPRSRTIP